MWTLHFRNLKMLQAMLETKPDLAKLYPYGTTLGDAAKKGGLKEAEDMIRAAGGTFSDE